MNGVLIRTCAKVNLSLRVLGRRPDGYHEIQTVMQAVSLWDCLGLKVGGEGGPITLHVSGTDAPTGETNTCWRAARVMSAYLHVSAGVDIQLRKSIPVAAGLGGGSSDAAATLAGLARLWHIQLSERQLEKVAADIGADVPFFLRGGCCLARGTGEKLRPLPTAPMWLVVVVPQERVPTPQAYAALRPPAAGSPASRRLSRPIQRMISALREGDPSLIAQALHNDFEAVALPGLAAAREAKAALISAGCLGASVSGSGSAVFGIARHLSEAQAIAARLGEEWPWVQVVRTLPARESMVISHLSGPDTGGSAVSETSP